MVPVTCMGSSVRFQPCLGIPPAMERYDNLCESL
jgi:hypothetical protein